MNGTLITFENNSMSLSCRAEMIIIDSIIIKKRIKGYHRYNRTDTWMKIYQKYNIGDALQEKDFIDILSYNNINNIISKFKEKK